MIEETFASGISCIHRVDPRVRIAYAIVYSVAVALLSGLLPMLASLVLSVAFVLSAGLGIAPVMWRLLLFNSMIGLFWLIVPFTFEGEALFFLGQLNVSREGVAYALAITLKSNSIFLSMLALLTTMSVAEIGYAMQRLGFPSKVVALLLLTYRYVFVMEQEYLRLMRAAKARGFKGRTDLHTYRTYAYFIGMLFVRAWERAERVHMAMKCRGFDGRFHCLREYSLSWRDLAFIGAGGAGLLLVGVVECIPMIR